MALVTTPALVSTCSRGRAGPVRGPAWLPGCRYARCLKQGRESRQGSRGRCKTHAMHSISSLHTADSRAPGATGLSRKGGGGVHKVCTVPSHGQRARVPTAHHRPPTAVVRKRSVTSIKAVHEVSTLASARRAPSPHCPTPCCSPLRSSMISQLSPRHTSISRKLTPGNGRAHVVNLQLPTAALGAQAVCLALAVAVLLTLCLSSCCVCCPAAGRQEEVSAYS